MLRARKALSLLALAAAAGPGCRDQRVPAPSDDGRPSERVFEAPPRVVRAVPPHRIQPGEIGPYRLGDDLKKVLNTLPHGPRIEILQIDPVVSFRLVRVAQDSMLVGIGQSGVVSFIAVLGREIAKTESGLAVGSDIAKLREALGPEVPASGARDSRLVELEGLRGARVLIDRDKVSAIVIGSEAPAEGDLAPADALSGGGSPGTLSPVSGRAAAPATGEGGCTAASAAAALADEPVTEVAKVAGSKVVVLHGCFTGGSPEAVVVGRDELVLVVGEPGRLRRSSATPVPGLLFASAVDADRDGRDEIIAVSEKRTGEGLTVRVEALRGDGGRLVDAGADDVYRVTAGAAASVGAKLKDVSLLVEATAGPEAVEVSGFYLHQEGTRVRTVAPLVPRTVVLRPRKKGDGGSTSSSAAGRASKLAPAAERSVAP